MRTHSWHIIAYATGKGLRSTSYDANQPYMPFRTHRQSCSWAACNMQVLMCMQMSQVPHLMRVNLLQTGGVACQHLNPEPRHWVQIAARVALGAKLSEPSQLLQGLQVVQHGKPALPKLSVVPFLRWPCGIMPGQMCGQKHALGCDCAFCTL